MNLPVAQPPPLPDNRLRDLDIGCRVGLLVLTLILGYLALRMSWMFYDGDVARIHGAMLKGSPAPLSMQLAEGGKAQWLLLSAALPAFAAVAALSVRRALFALLSISACNAALAFIILLQATAIFSGISQILGSLI